MAPDPPQDAADAVWSPVSTAPFPIEPVTGPVALGPTAGAVEAAPPAEPMTWPHQVTPPGDAYVALRPLGEPLVTIQIAGREVTLDANFARIDYDRIAEQAADIDNEVLWVAILANRAERRAEELDLALDVMTANVNKEIGLQYAGRPRGEAPTVDQRKALVDQDPRVIEAKRQHIIAKEQAADLKAAMFALVRTAERLTALGHLVIQARGLATGPTPASLHPSMSAARVADQPRTPRPAKRRR